MLSKITFLFSYHFYFSFPEEVLSVVYHRKDVYKRQEQHRLPDKFRRGFRILTQGTAVHKIILVPGNVAHRGKVHVHA